MKRIRMIYNFVVARVLIDGLASLSELLNAGSLAAHEAKQNCYNLFWSPVE